MRMDYRVTWTEVSNHTRDLTPDELADLLGVEVSELSAKFENDEVDGELADALADLDDDGFEFLTREQIEIWELGEEG